MNKQHQYNHMTLLYLIGIITVMMILVGCSSKPSPIEVNPTQGAQILAGDYVMQLDQEDIERSGLINAGLENNLGTWHFILDDAGNFEATLNGSYIAQGIYTVKDDQVELYVQKVCADCDCENNIGRYYWSLDGNSLRFAKIVDSCDPMVLVLTSKPLIR